jgi:hypothetical protein
MLKLSSHTNACINKSRKKEDFLSKIRTVKTILNVPVNLIHAVRGYTMVCRKVIYTLTVPSSNKLYRSNTSFKSFSKHLC